MEQTTIAAVSTPAGTGGIGIVRLSGPDAIAAAGRMFRPKDGRRLDQAAGYTGMLGRVFDSGGDLDDCIAFVYRAPKSYTGEDVVELSCHGGPWIMRRVLRLCLEQGAVPAAPGEFTRRAFQNGKLGLDQAEAVLGLIGAQGESAARAALSARDGKFSTEIERIVEKILARSAHLAAWADYPEEELEPVDRAELAQALCGCLGEIDALLNTWDRGKLLTMGVRTVIAGRPNAGKSTLMNLLAGEDRSIVTEVPGTTRDIVEESVQAGGIVLRLADTAGIRGTADPVERIGVERAKERIESAELVLAVFDGSAPLTPEDRLLLDLLEGRRWIAAVNKSDLPQTLEDGEIRRKAGNLVRMSAKTGQGRAELERVIAEVLGLSDLDPTAPMVLAERQRAGLAAARAAVEEARTALAEGMTLDAVAVLLDGALDALLALTGRRVTEAVADEVFARFCVGK